MSGNRISTENELICIGGDYDGQMYLPNRNRRDELVLPGRQKMSALDYDIAKNGPIEAAPMQIYLRDMIGFRHDGKTEYIEFWRHASITGLEAIRMVFARYAGPRGADGELSEDERQLIVGASDRLHIAKQKAFEMQLRHNTANLSSQSIEHSRSYELAIADLMAAQEWLGSIHRQIQARFRTS
jgi:hypothetical protein